MPHPDDMRRQVQNQMPDFAALLKPQPADELAAEVAALRREVAALHEALIPVPSLIQTGRDVLDEFKRLTRATTQGQP